VAPILVTKHTMGNIVLCPMILRFQESRRFQNDSPCRAQVPSSPIGSFGVGGYAKPDLVRHVYLRQHRTCIYFDSMLYSFFRIHLGSSPLDILCAAPARPCAKRGGGVRRPKFPWAPFFCCLRFKLENSLKERNCYDMDQFRVPALALYAPACAGLPHQRRYYSLGGLGLQFSEFKMHRI
jgi:hypothetical protein